MTLTRKTTLISTFCVAFHIFIVGEHRDFKFGVRVDRRKSQPTDDKLSVKGAWSRHVPHLNFGSHKISIEHIKLETSNFVHWVAM